MGQLIGTNEDGQIAPDAVDLLRSAGLAHADQVAELSALADRGTRAEAARRHVSYPSYWWASWFEGAEKDLWGVTLADPATVGFVIVNPNSGPGDAESVDWQTQAEIARGAGATVLGYVSTDYANAGIARDGSRTHEAIIADIAKYRAWYGVDGIFLDEVSNGWGDAQKNDHTWYAELTAAIREAHPGIVLVGNAGTNTRPEYLPLFDVLVTFEKSAAEYLAATDAQLTPNEYRGQPASKFWHMVHDVTSPAQATAVLERAAKSNVGHLYVTDDTNAHEPPAMWGNPYDRPPAAWLLAKQRAWARGTPPAVPDVSTRRNRVSIIGDSFSSPGYGSNHGHIWHLVAMSHADGTLVANYAQNGHTASDAITGLTASWEPDIPNAQLTKAKADVSQSVIVCLGYNDQNNSVPRETFYANMRRIARELRTAGKQAIIMQPPIPVRARAEAIPALRDYLSDLPALCDEEGAIYLRTWDLIGDTQGLPPEYDQGDGSHMNAAGHEAVGRAIAPRLRKAIEGLGEYAAAIRTPRPFTASFETLADGATSPSTAKIITAPESSRDIFPSGEAVLMDLGMNDNPYVSISVKYQGENLGGARLKFTFSYEVISMPAAKVSNGTASAGLQVQAGTYNPWSFEDLWGGVKLQGSRGVASVIATVPADLTEYVFALTLHGVKRASGDAPAQVRVGAGRIERI